jgi:hypothetical protein
MEVMKPNKSTKIKPASEKKRFLWLETITF